VSSQGVKCTRRAVAQRQDEQPRSVYGTGQKHAKGVSLIDLQGVQTAELVVGPEGGLVTEGRGLESAPEGSAGILSVGRVQVLAEAAPLVQSMQSAVGLEKGGGQHLNG
jgi:hypothetical protein